MNLLEWICWSGFARGEFAGENPQGRICRCGFAGMNLPVMDWPVGRCGSAGFAGVDLPGWIRRGGLAGVDLGLFFSLFFFGRFLFFWGS